MYFMISDEVFLSYFFVSISKKYSSSVRHFKSSTTPEENKTNLDLQTKTPQMFFLHLAEKNPNLEDEDIWA